MSLWRLTRHSRDAAPASPLSSVLGVGDGDRVKVLNIHERELQATSDEVGSLIDSLASREDALWPRLSWPRMKFDRELRVDAWGGHGPIRYFVEGYAPGKSIKFRFSGPRGFDGFHGYECIKTTTNTALLRHTLKMTTHGVAVLSWPIVFRPMHDALLEDSLSTAEASLGQVPQVHAWSAWVRFLRWVVSRGKTRPQLIAQQGAAVDRPCRGN